MLSIIHRYLLKELFYYLAVLASIFCVIIIAKETYDTRDEILGESPAWVDVAQYIGLAIPGQLVEAIPLLSMFAVLFALGLMTKNRETLAMVAAGVPFTYLAIPVAIFGLMMTAVSFYVTEYVAPDAQNRARFIFEVKIKGENQFSFTSSDEIFRKGEGGKLYQMARFDAENKRMEHPSIIDLNEERSGPARRIEAERASFLEKENAWEFEGAQVWTFNKDGTVAGVQEYDVPVLFEMEDKLDLFLSREKKPEEMRVAELDEYADILQRQGGNAQLPRYRTWVQSKLALPFSSLLLALVGFGIAVDLKTRRFVLAFSVGLAFGIGYILLRESIVGLGYRGWLPPAVAAWAPVAAFAGVFAILLKRLSTVH